MAMFTKRLFQKAMPQNNLQHGRVTLPDLDLQVAVHYGIPSTASILAFDPIQRLLAIGTLDGRIKIIGGDNIEVLLISPKKVPYKSLEFLHNQGFLVGVSNENDIQVWNLECRRLTCSLEWEANITAFAVIHVTNLMYVGDESGLLSVLKYEDESILKLPYHIPENAITEAAGVWFPSHHPIVGIVPQPCTFGSRVLIAYENGLLILWDVAEGQIVNVRGYTDLQLKEEGDANSVTGVSNELQGNITDHEQGEKEICSLCWASSTGSVLAVGYINGDILFWKFSSDSSIKEQAGKSTSSVLKLQLASGNRRLPVIVLHWSANNKVDSDKGGQLFIYGGDEMGSEEVITVLGLEWSSGIETLRCISRVELGLKGSFADMILIPNSGTTENNSTAALFVLTNPGQIDVYDGAILSLLKSDDGKSTSQAEKFPVVVPTTNPSMTVAKLCLLPVGKCPFNASLENNYGKRMGASSILSAGTKWPLTGGVLSELICSEGSGVGKIYIAGYEDGSVKIWDATFPVLTLMFVIEGKVPGIEGVDGETASVSALDFCSISMTLAVGNVSGLVSIYQLRQSTDEITFHAVSEIKHDVHIIHPGKGFHCVAAFFVLKSAIRILQFTSSGERLAVGSDSGQVAMLDLSSQSIVFCKNHISGTNSPVVSIVMHVIPQNSAPIGNPKDSSSNSSRDSVEVSLLVLTKDARITAIDSANGNMLSLRPIHPKKDSTAITMYVLEGDNAVYEGICEKQSEQLPDDNSIESEPAQGNNPNGSRTQEAEQHCSGDPLLLLCCEDALRLYSLKSVMQGNNKYIRKVNLGRHCCWSSTFKKRDEKSRGLILLYQTGVLEIRSLPDLKALAESSLMSVLRWSFKADMVKTMSSCDNGQISLVNGCEVAFLSLMACGNDFRIPESLPCLHDKVLAAAADAAISLSTKQKKRQIAAPGIIGGIIRGLKGSKAEKDTNCADSITRSSHIQKLEGFFSMAPFSHPTTTACDEQEEEEELSIDDIVIDEVTPSESTSFPVAKDFRKVEDKEREKLFQGASNDLKPRVRTTQEIITKYRFDGDASAAAAHARDKLAQRQEKLQRISDRAAELQSGAESFASMANELAKTMENKKWWKI